MNSEANSIVRGNNLAKNLKQKSKFGAYNNTTHKNIHEYFKEKLDEICKEQVTEKEQLSEGEQSSESLRKGRDNLAENSVQCLVETK